MNKFIGAQNIEVQLSDLIEDIFNGWVYLHLLFKLKQVKLPLLNTKFKKSLT